MKFFLTVANLKQLVSKNQIGLKEKLREMKKPIRFQIIKKEFEELTRDICNNQDNNDFKIVINERTYGLKNVKKMDGSNYT